MDRRRLVSTLLVLVLLGSAVSLVLALTRPDQESDPRFPGEAGRAYHPAELVGPGGPALAAAAAALPSSLSYDYRDLDASLAAATRMMTGRFARTFTKTFDRRVRPTALRGREVAKASVHGAGLVRLRGETGALCLVYVDQLVVESKKVDASGEPEVRSRNRVLVSMVLRSGTWRVDGIEPQ